MHYEISPARYEDIDAIAELARQSGELHQKKSQPIFVNVHCQIMRNTSKKL